MDLAAIASVLRECGNRKALALGKLLHGRIIESGFVLSLFLGNRLILMYSLCESVRDARLVFDHMPERSIVSWNAIIAAYGQNKHSKEALEMFGQMHQERVQPDKVTFVHILTVCARLGDQALGKLAHSQILVGKLQQDVVLGNALINMYGKCGNVKEARCLFDGMHRRDIGSWNTMVMVYSRSGESNEAFKLYQQMLCKGFTPDKITFVSILGACARPDLAMAKIVHAHITDAALELDVIVGNALVSMYGRCGRIRDARRIFDKMPMSDVVSWTGMIDAYSRNGYGDKAFELFQQMQWEGLKPNKITFVCILNGCSCSDELAIGELIHQHIIDRGLESDVFVGTALFNMYGRCGSIEIAYEMFCKLSVCDLVSWNAMILVFGQHGYCEMALKLYSQMQQEGMMPDKVTFVNALSACANPNCLALGKQVHTDIVDRGLESDVIVGTALVDMYGKCGSIRDARIVFDKMLERTVVSWSVMIAAYAQHGYGKDALEVFYQMQRLGMKPNEITFVNILNACNHAGMVDEGLHYFHSMNQDHGITTKMEHYNCLVDLLGRAGWLDEAELLINKMPLQPDAVIWMTLLGSCRNYGCNDLSKYAAEHAIQLDPQFAPAYVMLSNIYAAAGRWDVVAEIRELMRKRDLKKEPGYSCIEVNNKLHKFTANDTSHPQTEEIYAEMDRLNQKIEDVGYLPDRNLIQHDVGEEKKDDSFSYHSERLAIVYGIISTPCGTPLFITKNLRMCVDCHAMSKFISKIVGRVIVVRDANRFHHFNNGVCSCVDYW